MATWVLKWRYDDSYYAGPEAEWPTTDKKGAHHFYSRAEAYKEQQRAGGANSMQVLRRGPSKYKVPNGMELVPCLIAVEVIARALSRAISEGSSPRAIEVLRGDLAHWLAKVDEQRA